MPRRRRPPRAGALTELPPMRIAAQIVSLQALYYVAATVLFLFTALVSGSPFSFRMILGWEYLRGDTSQGWLLSFIWVLDGGFCMALAIIALVARSKLVPDFALTIHGVHLVLVTLVTRSLPRTTMWWATMLLSSALATGVGIWGCRYRELQPVFFGGSRVMGQSGGAAVGRPPAEEMNDEEDELGRPRTDEEHEMTKLDPRPL